MRTDAEGRGEEVFQWTLSSGKADGAIGTRVRKEDTLCRRLVQSHCLMLASRTPACPIKFMPQCLPCQPSQLPAEKGMRVWNSDTLFCPLSPPTRIASLPALPFQPGSGSQKVQEQAGEPSYLSHSPLSAPLQPPHIRLQLLARSLCISPSFPRFC